MVEHTQRSAPRGRESGNDCVGVCAPEYCVNVARRAHNDGRRYGRVRCGRSRSLEGPERQWHGHGTRPLNKWTLDVDQVAADQPPTTRCSRLLLLAAAGHMKAIRRVGYAIGW